MTKDKRQWTKDLIFTLVARLSKPQRTKDKGRKTKDLIFTLVALEATNDERQWTKDKGPNFYIGG